MRHRVIDFRHRGSFGIVWTRPVDADLGVAMDNSALARERRPDVLRFRLGDDAGRDRFPGDFSRFIRHAATRHRDVATRVGAFPHHVRRGHDQDALRPMLARFNLPFLSLRNSATAESAELVSPSFTAMDP